MLKQNMTLPTPELVASDQLPPAKDLNSHTNYPVDPVVLNDPVDNTGKAKTKRRFPIPRQKESQVLPSTSSQVNPTASTAPSFISSQPHQAPQSEQSVANHPLTPAAPPMETDSAKEWDADEEERHLEKEEVNRTNFQALVTS